MQKFLHVLITVLRRQWVHFLFFVLSILFLLPVFFTTPTAKANDLNGTDLQQVYFRDSIRNSHIFPQWNPYIQQGLPLTADPMFFAYNPVISLPIIFAPNYDAAIKIIYLLSLFLAMETTFYLAKTFIPSQKISFFLALNYALCGFFAARITPDI